MEVEGDTGSAKKLALHLHLIATSRWTTATCVSLHPIAGSLPHNRNTYSAPLLPPASLWNAGLRDRAVKVIHEQYREISITRKKKSTTKTTQQYTRTPFLPDWSPVKTKHGSNRVTFRKRVPTQANAHNLANRRTLSSAT